MKNLRYKSMLLPRIHVIFTVLVGLSVSSDIIAKEGNLRTHCQLFCSQVLVTALSL